MSLGACGMDTGIFLKLQVICSFQIMLICKDKKRLHTRVKTMLQCLYMQNLIEIYHAVSGL